MENTIEIDINELQGFDILKKHLMKIFWNLLNFQEQIIIMLSHQII